jgi:hypothetical protein
MPNVRNAYKTAIIFQQPTVYLSELQAHLTTMLPKAGYEPHVDAYDVAILVLSGRLETLGQVIEPHDVIFYAAGEPHGMRNIGRDVARYLVFEFHGAGSTKSELKANIGELKAKKLKAELARSQKETAKLKAELAAVYGSHSLRVTAPLGLCFS